MFAVILLILLISFGTVLSIGYQLGTFGSIIVTVINIGVAMLASFFLLSESQLIFCILDLWEWVKIGDELVYFSLRFDELTALMFCVVLIVSFLVHVYATVYMFTDPSLTRFMSYLTLFTLFMLVLVSSNNFVLLFVGWEGVGLCSYLLISFWYTRFQAIKAATKAFVINKIGDLFLLSGFSFLFVILFSFDFSFLTAILHYTYIDILTVCGLFFLFGAVGKSAQIGLHTWLPDAMEGPTPVSALIHAATMVTAGIFLILRAHFVFELSVNILYIATIWGSTTALISGIIGIAQNDIKKIIAYSTCSQLGYMLLACGYAQYHFAFFHLFNHAFFKALLFLSAGSVIHILKGEQDIRKMGGLVQLAPLVYINVIIGSLALAGIPFLTGFYSKDAIIEIVNTRWWIAAGFNYWAAISAALLTCGYSLKLMYFVFMRPYAGNKNLLFNSGQFTGIEALVLSLLAIFSFGIGFDFKDQIIGFGSDYYNQTTIFLGSYTDVIIEFLAPVTKLYPLVGSLLILLFFVLSLKYHTRWFANVNFESAKFYYNEFTNLYIGLPIFNMGRSVYEIIEKHIFESRAVYIYFSFINRFTYKKVW